MNLPTAVHQNNINDKILFCTCCGEQKKAVMQFTAIDLNLSFAGHSINLCVTCLDIMDAISRGKIITLR